MKQRLHQLRHIGDLDHLDAGRGWGVKGAVRADEDLLEAEAGCLAYAPVGLADGTDFTAQANLSRKAAVERESVVKIGR